MTTGVPERDADDEPRRLRRLQMMMQMVQAVIAQGDISLDEAADLAAGARRAALALFPGKELAFDLIYRPRLDRLIAERYGLR
ncbi:MAG TPA: hypothetical protein VE996_05025 [Terriglobales bacterium]|nr:hypothetical protein [Terriglobales bacterium]